MRKVTRLSPMPSKVAEQHQPRQDIIRESLPPAKKEQRGRKQKIREVRAVEDKVGKNMGTNCRPATLSVRLPNPSTAQPKTTREPTTNLKTLRAGIHENALQKDIIVQTEYPSKDGMKTLKREDTLVLIHVQGRLVRLMKGRIKNQESKLFF